MKFPPPEGWTPWVHKFGVSKRKHSFSHKGCHTHRMGTEPCSRPNPTQIYSNSFDLIQICSVAFRYTQHQTKASLRSAWPLSDSFRLMQPRTDLLKLMQLRSVSHADSFRFTQPPSKSCRFTQIHQISFCLIQIQSKSFKFIHIPSVTF